MRMKVGLRFFNRQDRMIPVRFIDLMLQFQRFLPHLGGAALAEQSPKYDILRRCFGSTGETFLLKPTQVNHGRKKSTRCAI
jgi:hypothetical protein